MLSWSQRSRIEKDFSKLHNPDFSVAWKNKMTFFFSSFSYLGTRCGSETWLLTWLGGGPFASPFPPHRFLLLPALVTGYACIIHLRPGCNFENRSHRQIPNDVTLALQYPAPYFLYMLENHIPIFLKHLLFFFHFSAISNGS